MRHLATFEHVVFQLSTPRCWAAVDLTVYPSIHVASEAPRKSPSSSGRLSIYPRSSNGYFWACFFSAFDFKVFGTCPVVDTRAWIDWYIRYIFFFRRVTQRGKIFGFGFDGARSAYKSSRTVKHDTKQQNIYPRPFWSFIFAWVDWGASAWNSE